MKSTTIHACVFVNTPSSKVFVYQDGVITDVRTDQLTDAETTVLMAVQDAFNLARTKHGSFEYSLNICPIDFSDNNVVTAQSGLHILPAAIIDAKYPDGTGLRYAIGQDTNDKLFGANWAATDIYPYIRALLFGQRSTPANTDSVLCRLVPPLCNAGGWIWLALALGATYKATQARNIGKIIWGGGAFLLWKGYIERGGLSQLTSGAIGRRKRF